MTDQVYKNLGKFMSYEEKVITPGRPSKIMIKYTQPNYQDPKKVWEVGVFEDKISEELLEKIVSLSSGEEVCVHTVKNEKGYADLSDITDAKDAPARNTGGKSQYKKGGGNYPPKDDSGIAVGAAWTNAIEIIKGNLDVEDVAELAQAILDLKLKQEERLRASKKAKEETKTPEPEKKKSKLEEMKEKKAAAVATKKTTTKNKAPEPEEDFEVEDYIPELEDDSLDDITFDE